MSDHPRLPDHYPPGEKWKAAARCAGADQSVFFPAPSRGRPGAEHRADLRKVVSYCSQCPVRAECGRYAVREGLTHGIWGGMSADMRERLAAAGEL